MGIYGISDFGEIAAGNAAVSTINGAMAAAGAANDMAVSALTPPGGETASDAAVMKQIAAVNHYHAMFQMGMEQLMERVAGTTMYQGTSEVVQAINVAGLAL